MYEEPVIEGNHSSVDLEDLIGHESKRPKVVENLAELKAEETVPPEDVVATALSNVVIIKAILRDLPVPDLLRARHVNQTWKGVANTVLKSRPKPAFIVVKEETDFDELMCTIWTCGEENFPLRGLKVQLTSSDFGNKPERWTRLAFLRMFGHLFTHRRLHVNWSPSEDDVGGRDRSMASVLSGPMSNFEKIKIARGKGPFTGGNLKLEDTTVVKFETDYGSDDVDEEWLAVLLRACPNLREIRGIHFASMPGVIAAEKCELVVDMNYCYCYGDVGTLNHNHEGRRLKNLRSLEICRLQLCNPIMFEPVREILEASANTLNYLDVGCELRGSRDGTWPELRELKHLFVSGGNSFSRQMSNVFTALTQVTLQSLYFSSGSTLRDFLWDDPMPSVKTLHIDCRVNPTDMPYLATIFPNVSSISIDCYYLDREEWYGPYQHLLWDIWRVKEFEQLRKLTIVDVSVSRMAKEKFSLDAFLTGYPQFIINKLRAQPELILKDPAYTDLMREAAANVTSLKCLQTLSISFGEFTKVKPEHYSEETPFVSDFLLEAGLNALPGLQTKFFYNFSLDKLKTMEKLLRPVSHLIPIQSRP